MYAPKLAIALLETDAFQKPVSIETEDGSDIDVVEVTVEGYPHKPYIVLEEPVYSQAAYKELEDKVSELESRVSELETEIQDLQNA